jgi:uncharacterized metal-binding protein
MSTSTVCSGSNKLIFACSGAADVGALSDKAARELTQEGFGRMFCAAGLSGNMKPILKTTQEAETIVALDGCPLDCVKNSLDNLSISNYIHVRATDLGLDKGRSEITPKNVNKIKDKVKDIIS